MRIIYALHIKHIVGLYNILWRAHNMRFNRSLWKVGGMSKGKVR